MILRISHHVFCLALAVGIAGCASTVRMDGNDKLTNYSHHGEKYNAIAVSWSDSLAADADKVSRIHDLRLDKAIANHLIKSRLYDTQSAYSIDVLVTDFRFRNAANAILFGFLSGSDNLDGVVTLKNPDGTQLVRFTISASYALGGVGGGNNEDRLGWLSGKFADLAANTILNKQPPSEQAGK